MSFEYRLAVREKQPVLVGLSGPSGSGKTRSALRLARGLVGPEGRIGFVDTENGRALQHVGACDFHHGLLKAPFDPAAYSEAVDVYEKAGFDAVVIDSMSHEYAGEGGIQEWANRLEDGEPKPGIENPNPYERNDWITPPIKSPGNWKEPKQAHKTMIYRFLQCRTHLIFCLRAEEKIKIETVNRKTVIVPVGWKPITEKNFMYEMGASFMLSEEKPGVPTPIKNLQDSLRDVFPAGELITEETGKLLAKWANANAELPKPRAQAPLHMVRNDGTINVVGTPGVWLSEMLIQLDEKVSKPRLQKMWDANIDTFYRLEEMSRQSGDNLKIAAVNQVGLIANQHLGQAE